MDGGDDGFSVVMIDLVVKNDCQETWTPAFIMSLQSPKARTEAVQRVGHSNRALKGARTVDMLGRTSHASCPSSTTPQPLRLCYSDTVCVMLWLWRV